MGVGSTAILKGLRNLPRGSISLEKGGEAGWCISRACPWLVPAGGRHMVGDEASMVPRG